MYHDVCDADELSGFDGADAQLYKVSSSQFARHLGLIVESATEVSLVNRWDQRSLGVFLTFDDGGSSAIKAAEQLESRGWRGHFFVTTGRIGSPGFVTKQQIVELDARGHVVGTHSHTHPLRMGGLSKGEILDEWRESCGILGEILGKEVKVGSVPGGMYSRAVGDAAARCGIEFLFTSEPKISTNRLGSCLILGRYTVGSRTSAQLVSALAAGKFGPRVFQSVVWNAKKPAKLIGGARFLQFRKWILARMN